MNSRLYELHDKVWVALKRDDNKYVPISGVINGVLPDKLFIWLSTGSTEISPDSRRVCFTYDECSKVCFVLNRLSGI